MKPKVKILYCQLVRAYELEREVEDLVANKKPLCVVGTMKVTWLTNRDYITCIIEWCENERDD